MPVAGSTSSTLVVEHRQKDADECEPEHLRQGHGSLPDFIVHAPVGPGTPSGHSPAGPPIPFREERQKGDEPESGEQPQHTGEGQGSRPVFRAQASTSGQFQTIAWRR